MGAGNHDVAHRQHAAGCAEAHTELRGAQRDHTYAGQSIEITVVDELQSSAGGRNLHVIEEAGDHVDELRPCSNERHVAEMEVSHLPHATTETANKQVLCTVHRGGYCEL